MQKLHQEGIMVFKHYPNKYNDFLFKFLYIYKQKILRLFRIIFGISKMIIIWYDHLLDRGFKKKNNTGLL